MKTPEEIKNGLECCINCDCDNCHYRELKLDCGDYLKADSILLINQLEEHEWELFSLLSSAFYGKQCYFKQDGEVKLRYFKVDDGLVYSRVTGKYLSFDQAIDEFAEMLTGEDEAQSGTDMNVPTITGETSDGYHTFNELYHHRAVLFSVIVKAFPDKAWKSRLHSDGSMFDGMFIVGIDTPDGPATYHYDIEPYWDMFRCIELERAPEWDGHTAEQAINRIMKLEPARHGRWIKHKAYVKTAKCSECKTDFTKIVISDKYPNYCPNCGTKMRGDTDG